MNNDNMDSNLRGAVLVCTKPALASKTLMYGSGATVACARCCSSIALQVAFACFLTSAQTKVKTVQTLTVGSWCFTLGALCCLVTKLAADVASAMKSGSSAKLHRNVTAVTLLLNGNRHRNMTFALTTVVYVSRGKG